LLVIARVDLPVAVNDSVLIHSLVMLWLGWDACPLCVESSVCKEWCLWKVA